MAAVFRREDSFKSAPLLDHARQKLCAPGVKCGVEMHWNAQGHRRGHQMALRGVEDGGVAEEFVHRYFIPPENIERIEMVNHGQRVGLVQARYYTPIFDIRQAANVQNKLRAASMGRQLKARALDIAIS